MKKTFFFMALMIGLVSQSFAQFNLGIKGGFNYNKIKAEDKEFDNSGILGYNVGVWARFGTGFYIQPEVYLGSKGSKFKFDDPTVDEVKANFTTIDVPLLLGTKFGVNKLNVRLMAGPSFQYNLSSDDDAFKNVVNPDFYKYRDFVTNLQGGVGVDIGDLAVDVRYETSLQDINKNNGQKQDLIHVSLGFKIF